MGPKIASLIDTIKMSGFSMLLTKKLVRIQKLDESTNSENILLDCFDLCLRTSKVISRPIMKLIIYTKLLILAIM